MAPRNEKIALVVALVLSSFVAWNIWVGAPQFSQVARAFSLDLPGYIEPIFRYRKAFIVLPVLVAVAWLLPQARKRGWICLGIGGLSVLLLASVWIPFLSARASTG